MQIDRKTLWESSARSSCPFCPLFANLPCCRPSTKDSNILIIMASMLQQHMAARTQYYLKQA
jgi:hypothetical protein